MHRTSDAKPGGYEQVEVAESDSNGRRNLRKVKRLDYSKITRSDDETTPKKSKKNVHVDLSRDALEMSNNSSNVSVAENKEKPLRLIIRKAQNPEENNDTVAGKNEESTEEASESFREKRLRNIKPLNYAALVKMEDKIEVGAAEKKLDKKKGTRSNAAKAHRTDDAKWGSKMITVQQEPVVDASDSFRQKRLRNIKPPNYAALLKMDTEEQSIIESKKPKRTLSEDDGSSSGQEQLSNTNAVSQIQSLETSEVNEYNLERQKNIAERQRLLRELDFGEFKVKSPEKPKARVRKENKINAPARKSNRIMKVPPPQINIEADDSVPPPAPPVIRDLERFVPMYFSENAEEHKQFLQNVKQNLDVSISSYDLSSCSLEEYYAVLNKLRMWSAPTKVTDGRITALDMHPSTSKILALCGNRFGKLSLYSLKEGRGIHIAAHKLRVNCVSFGKRDQAKIFSTSHDGTVRRADIETAKMELIYSTTKEEFETRKWSHMTWHCEVDNSLYAAVGVGEVRSVDLRTLKVESVFKCHDRSVRTVQSHPVDQNYFITSSGIGEFGIWDVRKSDKKVPVPVCLVSCKKAVHSAFFSPTGSKVVITCVDDTVQVYNSSDLQDLNLLSTIPHNNNTGRWLSPFKANWFPGRDDIFHIGSLLFPRRIQIFEASEGKLLGNLTDDNLNTVCSLISVHPTLPLLVGGNSSGRLHTFSAENELCY